MADGLNRGWTTKAVVLNGKLYTMDNVYKPLVRKHIQVYNSSKDAWDTVDGTWDTIDGDSLEHWDVCWLDDVEFEDWDKLGYRETFMENVELANLGGKLCIISTEVHDMVAGSEPDSDDHCGQEDVVTLRIVEITESDGYHYFSLEFKDEITEKIRYPNPQKATRLAATSCQVVGL